MPPTHSLRPRSRNVFSQSNDVFRTLWFRFAGFLGFRLCHDSFERSPLRGHADVGAVFQHLLRNVPRDIANRFIGRAAPGKIRDQRMTVGWCTPGEVRRGSDPPRRAGDRSGRIFASKQNPCRIVVADFCLYGCFSKAPDGGVRLLSAVSEGPLRRVCGRKMLGSCRFRGRAESGMPPWAAFADYDEKRTRPDRPATGRDSRRDTCR